MKNNFYPTKDESLQFSNILENFALSQKIKKEAEAQGICGCEMCLVGEFTLNETNSKRSI